MNKELLNKIENFLNREENCSLVGKPASIQEIKNAEKMLNVKFNDQYVQFIKLFGGAYGGLTISAFNNGDLIGKSTVVDLTLKFRMIFKEEIYDFNGIEFEGESVEFLLKNSYVISDDGSGNPILMNERGEIFIFLHDSGEVELLYYSLEELLIETYSKIS
ncbi:SMI1 / KNR4 family protein [Paenibacillus alvei TS-15]|uniref:SMI1 / KNR4 family protein n=1 Tax=Paenibacillus alvei TS-15 TaxID=1117108 RepID=S9SWY4_PAEAL|nr:SMI1/KNR4 family protein [Paenibacillus alvei]EPY08598.1 SMI1 / KNR4 family protein [Paenibacillus alvei TS-15]